MQYIVNVFLVYLYYILSWNECRGVYEESFSVYVTNAFDVGSYGCSRTLYRFGCLLELSFLFGELLELTTASFVGQIEMSATNFNISKDWFRWLIQHAYLDQFCHRIKLWRHVPKPGMLTVTQQASRTIHWTRHLPKENRSKLELEKLRCCEK